MSSRWWGHYQFGNEIVLKRKCADFVRWRYFMKEEVGIQDSVSFHSHSPLLDPNPDVFYQILTRRGICSWNLMLMFSSISGLRDGKLEDSTHLTLVEKLTGDLLNWGGKEDALEAALTQESLGVIWFLSASNSFSLKEDLLDKIVMVPGT